VYYPIDVLPSWMHPFAYMSPATYVLQGLRAALLENASIWSPVVWQNTWPLLLSGAITVPLGIYIFRLAERYAKRVGSLKRNG
jgi:ABC-2 type transport system permease protein